ncbi:MAG: hypothetical protein JEY79_17980 [Pseudodesulfovibrio sp.]|nr:hypothetical protein [Pseudodesulfovibrio sp.]
MDYDKFIKEKARIFKPCGFDPGRLSSHLFDFQDAITRWAIMKGRAALLEDCGLGKTPQQLEWAMRVVEKTGGRVLIVAPLAVAAQTVGEGLKFGVSVTRCRELEDVRQGVNITNYDRLGRFDPSMFSGVVLDESSILKAYSGKTRNQIIEMFKDTPYRLACTATPAPNDYMELGNHSEFLGVMTRQEMLATFFVHDGGDTQKWRLKGHAQSEFWKWVSSWAVMIRKPSDVGFDDGPFVLPSLEIKNVTIDHGEPLPGQLFKIPASTLMERRRARRESIHGRCEEAAKIANSIDGPVLVWCDLNDESAALSRMITGAVEIKGSDSQDHKESSMLGFSSGKIRCLVTKPSIAGFGMNWQHCSNVVFVGLSDSYEQYYQAVRRCWRFGQKNSVTVYIVTSDMEGNVVSNIKRKEAAAMDMAEQMALNMGDITKNELASTDPGASDPYVMDCEEGDNWKMYLGDCVDIYSKLESNSIGYTIFSPPFASLYTYSNSERDMGNNKNYEAFMGHFSFLVRELYRVTMPGRSVSFHCMNIPLMKERDGYIGLRNFRDDLIRMFESYGFIFHSEHVIWKDPLIEATRTKALGLAHKQIMKDATMCRAGLPDYLVTMRKPGENAHPVSNPDGFIRFVGDREPTETGIKYSHNVWRRYASPVWMDINQTRTLNYRCARGSKDERHICPLQLDVIERGIELWSKKGDTVSSPFAGIGSEGYVAVKAGRKFVGCELKSSYWSVAVKNLRGITDEKDQCSFDFTMNG